MPSSATITAFYSFTANSRARASQVNANFSIFRGHILPVDPNTQTSVDNTYDLGSSEYYWRTGYFSSIDIRTSTSTASLSISGDVSAASGAFVLKVEGVEKYRFKDTVASTTTASNGGFAIRNLANTSYSYTTSSTTIPDTTITIASTGRPIEFRMIPTPNTSLASKVEFVANTGTAGPYITVSLIRNGTTIGSVYSPNVVGPGARSTIIESASWFYVIDIDPAVGDNVYYLQYKGEVASSNLGFQSISLFGKQLIF